MSLVYRSLSVAVLLAALGCAGKKTECPCPPGQVCDADGFCRFLCNQTPDCLDVALVCIDGICVEASTLECYLDSDCRAPSVCHVPGRCIARACEYADELLPPASPCDDGNACTVGDLCDVSGACRGTPVICDDPPAATCVDDDGVYVDYLPRGVCEPTTGGCSYTVRRTVCVGCASNCLAVCAGVQCTDDNGGCRPNGLCTPGASPLCRYDQATDGTRCDRAGSALGSLDGVCQAGTCVDCLVAGDCSNPPGAVACFDGWCVGTACSYAVAPGRTCQAQACSGGFVSSPRVCDASGGCPDAGGTSCGGFACGGNTCLEACTSNLHCVASLECDLPTNQCLGQKADGQPCSTNVECLNTCVGGSCVDRAGTLGVCDDAADCPANHSCTTSVCKKLLGQVCSGGNECASTFCAGARCCESECSATCQACGSDGLCNVTPVDDARCPVFDCSTLSTACRTYSGMFSTDRCASFGACRASGSSACTSYADAGVAAVCRASSGAACDVPDTCDGGGSCGSEKYATGGTVCRVGAGYCDHTAEVCSGTSPDCPADGFAWQLNQTCSGSTLSTQTPPRGDPPAATSGLWAIASGRKNVTADDLTQCQLFCDETPDVNCCTISGFTLNISGPVDLVWCIVWVDATGLTPYSPAAGDIAYGAMCN